MCSLNFNPNEASSQSQNERIWQYLCQVGRITSLSALNQFGCLRLSARIKDLRDSGCNIADRYIKTPNGKRVKEYFINEQ